MLYSDMMTGNLYFYRDIFRTIFAVIAGQIVDILGVKKSFILGNFSLLFCRIILLVTKNDFLIWFSMLFG